MSADYQEGSKAEQLKKTLLVQEVKGSRRSTNFIVSSMVSIGGIGFLLAALSSYQGRDFLPLGHPASLIFIPQGLIMGLYGIAAFLLAIYQWTLVAMNFGAGRNCFDKDSGLLSVTRKGFFKEINLQVKLKDIKAVKLDVRDGINPRRRISLRLQGRNDLPLTGVGGKLLPLDQLEEEGAELAAFLEVNLEGL